MSKRDFVQLTDDTIAYGFPDTGESGSFGHIRLNRSLRIFAAGCKVFAENDAGNTMCIEQFGTPKLALACQTRIASVASQYLTKRRRAFSFKRAARWIGGGALVFYLVAIYGTLATISANTSSGAIELPSLTPRAALQALNAMESGSAILPVRDEQTTTYSSIASEQRPQPTLSPELAKQLLATGAASEAGYAIQLSSGPKGTIYVFADPACPACQELKPELATLGQNYTIHVFPVSVIGQEASAKLSAQMLCQPKETRAAAWRNEMRSSANSGNEVAMAACESGLQAVAQNDVFFRKAGFQGTPMVLDGDGYLLPEHIPHTSHAIAAWLQQSRIRDGQ